MLDELERVAEHLVLSRDLHGSNVHSVARHVESSLLDLDAISPRHVVAQLELQEERHTGIFETDIKPATWPAFFSERREDRGSGGVPAR